jgi:hypothetical protein
VYKRQARGFDVRTSTPRLRPVGGFARTPTPPPQPPKPYCASVNL